ncbi:MAG: hypothetical protein GTN40_03270 [Candidatus Aenigmarchaeota archaeon]|nr:hypothetical protein [Candidatus Aenigmarchaeota archaeon]
MKDNVIETSIDEFIQVLKEKGKISVSEAADFLSATQKQIEPWLNILEENGIIEIEYPVIGEPKIVLKATAPEKIDIKRLEAKSEEKVEEIKKEPERTELKEDITIIETPKIREKLEIKPEIRGEDIEVVTEKMEKLETKITKLSREVDISMLKEELSEILLIIAGLRDIEKISFYLKEVLSLIHKMKKKNIWTKEDKDLVTTMLRDIAENWRESGNMEIAKIFDGIKEKIKSA